jgi:prepilin-type N-terminal cleavage/methylation domain-containing protein
MMRSRAGFTLLELMLATALLGVILIFVFGTMLTTHKKAEALDDTVDVQQSARLIADVIERDLRHTGMMVVDAASFCAVDNQTATDRLFTTDWEAVTPGTDLRPSLGAVVSGATTTPSNGSFFDVDSLIMEGGTPDPTYDTNGDGTPDSDFQVNGSFIVADENNPSRGTACGVVTGVNLPNKLRITVTAGGLDPVPVGGSAARIVVVPAIEYRIDANQDLFRGPFQIASAVEDLQLAVFVDANTDNVVDANEYLGDGSSPNYLARGTDAAQIREVRLNLVLRTMDEDPDSSVGQPIATENRTATVTDDGFRRRVYTSVVRLRNLGRRIQL